MSSRRAIVGVVSSAYERDRIGAALVALGYGVTLADSTFEALGQARAGAPQLLVADAEFLAVGGDEMFREWREQQPGTPIVVLPGHASLEPGAGNGAARNGSGSMFTPELMLAVDRVVGTQRASNGVAARPERRRPPLDPFAGQSPAIRRLAEQARQALASESPILIEGETGTGKGVLAAWLHRHGPRAQEPFVDLNCAGFSRELMDSELFGHEKGAFTGAVTRKAGLLEVADRGTLFLDEIGDMEAPIQAKLLKVIEEKRFRRVGETRERHADVRVIAATHHNLLQRVRDGHFREDLYYRIGVLPMRVPALRFRAGDIPELARRILGQLSLELGRPEPELAEDAERTLGERAWPGNLRELRNELERAVLACSNGSIESRHLALDAPAGLPSFNGTEGATLADVERAFIRRVLDEEQQHVQRTARRLGIARSTFYVKLRQLGISARA
ncbi:MAG TPA: sigma-54 dependent transcriptional regulator [Candidatus Eisenbacteria bacterium]|jgi:DNA-binding NtrC family response regulator